MVAWQADGIGFLIVLEQIVRYMFVFVRHFLSLWEDKYNKVIA